MMSSSTARDIIARKKETVNSTQSLSSPKNHLRETYRSQTKTITNNQEQTKKQANKKRSSSTLYEPNEDSCIIFGSLPSSFFIQINDILDNSLVNGVTSLPLLPTSHQTVKFSIKNIAQLLKKSSKGTHLDPAMVGTSPNKKFTGLAFKNDNEKEEDAGYFKLLKILRKAYAKNIDKAEIYALRNIFSIEDLAQSKRRKLLDVIQKNVDLDELDQTLNPPIAISSSHDSEKGGNISNNDENDAAFGPLPSFPNSRDEIPTLPIESIEKAIHQLRTSILEKKRRRNEILLQLNQLRKTAGVVLKANHSIKLSIDGVTSHSIDLGKNRVNNEGNDEISTRKIQDIVNPTMMKKKVLQQLHNQGNALIKRLNNINKNKTDNDHDDFNEFLSHSKRRRTYLSLDDHFVEMKRRLPDTSNSDIEGALSMLKKKKQESKNNSGSKQRDEGFDDSAV